jgi:GNAT superfamily N-acetyltransferase
MIVLVRLDITDPETAGAVLQLQRRSYRLEAKLIGSDRIPPLQETVDELRSCAEEFLGAVADGQLAGATSWRFSDGVIDIHRLVVDPEHHRRGVGACLLRRVLDMEPTAARAIVQTGAKNAPAIALYLREGFERTEEVELGGLRISRFSKSLR